MWREAEEDKETRQKGRRMFEEKRVDQSRRVAKAAMGMKFKSYGDKKIYC